MVSPAGKVMKIWWGTYEGKLGSEIEVYFQIKLPGVIEAQAKK
jgi:hypothetical protein